MEAPSLLRILARRSLASSSACFAAPSASLRRAAFANVFSSSYHHRAHSVSSTARSSTTSRSLKPAAKLASLRTLSTSSSDASTSVLAAYQGPLHATFRRLKAFSLLSFALAGLITPVLLFGPGEVAMSGRIALSLTALMTSGVSTALIAWVGGPYVQRMRLLSPRGETKTTPPSMEMTTLDWLMRERVTEVTDPRIIKGTSRPFATWELDEGYEHVGGEERVVARTTDAKGAELGRWVVRFDGEEGDRWTSSGEEGSGKGFKRVGRLVKSGKVHKHFQVHEEALGDEWRVV